MKVTTRIPSDNIDAPERKGEGRISHGLRTEGGNGMRQMARRTTRAGVLVVTCLLTCVGTVARPAVFDGWLPGRSAVFDRGFNERKSAHFRLYQDVAIERYAGPHGWRRFEIRLLEILERAYDQVGDLLGIWPTHDIVVVVYAPEVFDSKYGSSFAFRTVGIFDGAIHVRGGTEVTQTLAGTLHHEYAHAAIQAQAGPGLFPAWLNEGLAEYVEALALGRRRLSVGQYRVLTAAVQDGSWIPLASLSPPSLAHLSSGRASLAYLESHAMVEYLARHYGQERLRRVCEELTRTRNLVRALDRTYHKTLAELEAEVQAELLRG